MSYPLEPIDLLVDVSKVLYNERIVEQMKQIEDLKSKRYYIYYSKPSINSDYVIKGYFISDSDNHGTAFINKINFDIANSFGIFSDIIIKFDYQNNNEYIYEVGVKFLDIIYENNIYKYVDITDNTE